MFIAKAQEDLGRLWDDLFVGEEDRRARIAGVGLDGCEGTYATPSLPSYRPFHKLRYRAHNDTTCLDDDAEAILNQHEAEIQRLIAEKHTKIPLLRSVGRYLEVCEDEAALAVSGPHPIRLQ